jgi:hypothetical protein
MTAVMIGIDPHKRSHTAVAISAAEEPLGDLRVRAGAAQTGTLAARVRLLQAGDTNKNDPNNALPVAVAALRSKARRQVAAEDHAAVLKVWAKRHRDLARARTGPASSTGCRSCLTWP